MSTVFKTIGNNSNYKAELLNWYNEVWSDIGKKYHGELVRVYEENGSINIALPYKDIKYLIYRTDEYEYTNEDVMYLLES